MQDDSIKQIKKYIENHSKVLSMLQDGAYFKNVNDAAEICNEAIDNGNKILLIGNGGSAADAQHIAAELVGRFMKERSGLPAIALTVNTSTLTAISNDYSFDRVFSRQVEAHGIRGDVLFGISTSGKSINILEALKVARSKGLKTIGLTGSFINDFEKVCDTVISIPDSNTPIIQEMHIMTGHLLCLLIENNL